MLDKPDPDFAKQREQMIEKAIRARGVRFVVPCSTLPQ